jgi:hypothetical protein
MTHARDHAPRWLASHGEPSPSLAKADREFLEWIMVHTISASGPVRISRLARLMLSDPRVADMLCGYSDWAIQRTFANTVKRLAGWGVIVYRGTRDGGPGWSARAK